MTTRRELIQAGAVLGAAAAPGAALATGIVPDESASLRPFRVAFDGRSVAGRAFGAEAERLGAAVRDTEGDVSRLYADELLERWRRSPVPVAGLTNHNSIFVLQMMATSAGLKLVWRAHHTPGPYNRFEHALFGPDAVRAEAGTLAGAEEAWARQAARLVMRLPANEATVARDRSNIAEAGEVALAPDAVVSWVLAPVRSV